MRIIRVLLWPLALAAGGSTAILVARGGIADSPAVTAAIGLVVGLSWSVVGLEEWRRRPGRRIGPLMVLFAFAWYAGLLVYSSVSVLYTLGLLIRPLFLAVFGHVLLAFPGGRLDDRWSRVLVAVAYLDTTLVVAASALFYEPIADGVTNLVLVEPDAATANALRNVTRGIGVAILLSGALLLTRRWFAATPPRRRAVAPVLWCGAAAAAVGALRLMSGGFDDAFLPVGLAFFVVLATVPLALELGLLHSRLARGAVAGLVVELGHTRAPGKLRDALSRALHDPALMLAYWLPEQHRYVDLEGRPVTMPAAGDPRLATTIVEHDGRRVAALVHDVSLLDEPELVEAVCAAAGLALQNERLQAELRANVEELRASRMRIVDAADAERRRLERDLHDGAQQRLVSVSMALGLAESRLGSDVDSARRILGESRSTLRAALQELRELSQGIHPGILSERGLGPALQELAFTSPVPMRVALALDMRLPQQVEAAAYFVVSEAITNVAKHAAAQSVSVSVRRADEMAVIEIVDDGAGGADPARGTGLRGLTDRVEALSGQLAIDSPPGGGTRLEARIPCGS